MSLLKKTILSVAVAATTFAAIPAEAGERWRHHGGYHSHGSSDGDLVAAGIVGLALGALAVGALNTNRQPVYADRYYRNPPPRPSRYYYEGAVARGGVEPWSRSWYRYCSNRYRSFDPQTGTYVGYDGRERFCNAN
ncbi:BA14K family protein [Arvimicrobium flavum]|uniref:BA14K family protein n=1 Tax=Arvimicrobium flavum TaxID=3393320 RepID=UPI00237A6459|nr:BA14K family protein [Mesorhizobium shangrilense]